jgi:cell wall-associated NlpC family hydrolase
MPRPASCVTDVAAIRAEPRDDAEQVTQALRGEPLEVLEERDGWARVETAYAYPGWIRAEMLGPASDDDWLPPRRTGDVVEQARAYLGAPYEWGGMTERGIDCSGLIHMAFRRLGAVIPRDSWQQAEAGEAVGEDELRPGDILCYEGHVAFWAGEGRIVHASARDGVRAVVEETEPDDLRARRLGARRLEIRD